MKKFFIIIGLIILVVVGGGVTLMLMSFNPAAYQKQVIASVKELTGRDLFVGGTTSVTWSPMPTIVMKNVRLSNISQSREDVMLTAESVRAEIEWASLFKTPLVVKSIELTKPVLLLERLESNRANFAFPFLLDPDRQLEEMDFLVGGSNSTKIDSVLIRDGRIRYVNRITGRDIELTQVEGALAVESLRGPFRFKGEGAIGRGKYSLSINTGMFKSSVPVDLSFKIGESDSGTAMDFSGRLTPDSSEMWFSGVGSFSVKKPNVLLESMGLPGTGAAEGKTAVGNLSIELSPVSDVLKDFTVRFGDDENAVALTGSIRRTVQGKVPVYDVTVGMNTFNPAEWRSYLDQVNWSWIEAKQNYPDVSFQMNAKSMLYNKENIQNLEIAGQYGSGMLRITKASAVLPGRTSVTVTGAAGRQGTTPILSLDTRLESDSVKTLISWLMPDNQWVKETKMLQKGSFAGRINLTPQIIGANVRELKLDASVMTGSIQRTLGDKPAYDIKAAVSNVNLDAYTGWQVPETPVDIQGMPMRIKAALEQAGWMSEAAVRAVIDINDGQVFNVPVSTIRASGYLANGVLKIDTLNLRNMATANIVLSGIAEGVGRPQMNLAGLTVKLETRQLPLLMERIKLTSALPLIREAREVTAEASVSGGRDGSWTIGLQAALSEANIRMSGMVDAVETQPNFRNFNFDIAHPNFRTFMQLIKPDFAALPKLDGTFKAKGVLTGTQRHFDIKDGLFGVGIQRLTGSMTFDDKRIRSITADVSTPSIDLERFLPETAFIYTPAGGFGKGEFDLAALDKWQWNVRLHAGQMVYRDLDIRQAEVDVQLADKALRLVNLSGINGTREDAPVKISGAFDWNTTPTLTAAFDIQNVPLRPDFMVLQDVAFGGGMLSATGELKARGSSPASLISQLSGEGTLSVQGGQIIGIDIEQMIPLVTRAVQRNEAPAVFEPQFKRVLTSGKTALKDIKGGFVAADGVIRMMDLTLDTANTVANPTQIIWDMPRRSLDISIPVTLRPLSDFPPFVLGISIHDNQSTYTPSFADLSAAVANRVQAAVTHQVQEQKAVALKAAAEKREDRLREAKQLAGDARAAVAEMDVALASYPSEKADLILQSARDALALVNQASVREEPTDAQLIQMIEQSRLVLLKADEFRHVLSRDTLFDTQKQMDVYRTRGADMTRQLTEWAAAHPDILILGRLVENAAQNRDLIERANAALPQLKNRDQISQTIAVAAEAFEKIEKAYEHAKRFDLAALATPTTEEVSEPAAVEEEAASEPYRSGYSSRGIKGTIGRAE